MDKSRLDAMLTVLMTGTHAITFIKDSQGHYLTVSEGLSDVLGLKREDIIGKTDFDLYPKAMAKKMRLDDKRIMASQETETYEEKVTVGEQSSLRLTTKGPLLINGKVKGVFVISRDISHLKAAQSALSFSEQRLKYEHHLQNKYLNTMQAMMVALDSDGRIKMINPYACQLLGYQREQLLGKNWFEICLPQPEGMSDIFPIFQSLMAGEIESTEYFENEVVTADGHHLMVAWHNALMEDEAGHIVGSLSSGVDLSKQKRTEDELRYRLDLEKALAEVTANLTRATDDNLDPMLDQALESMGRSVKAQRSYLFQVDPSGISFTNSHEWCDLGVDPQKEEFQSAPLEQFEGVFNSMSRNGFLYLTADTQADEELEPLRQFMAETGIASMINVPLFYEGCFKGFIGFDSEDNDRAWPEEDIRLLKTVAETFAAVLSRRASSLKIKAHTWYLESLDLVSKELVKEQDADALLEKLTQLILQIFEVDRAWLVYPCNPNAAFFTVPVESTVPEYPGAFAKGIDIPLDDYSSGLMAQAQHAASPVMIQSHGSDIPSYITELCIKSQMMIPLHPPGEESWLLGVHQCDRFREWSETEQQLFMAIADRVSTVLSNNLLLARIKDNERNLLEAGHIANLGYWEYDFASRLAKASPEVDTISGRIVNTEDGRGFFKQIVLEEDWPLVSQQLRNVILSGQTFEIEFRIVRPDGEIRWIYCKAERQLDSQGEAKKLLGIIQDITERKEIEERLRLSASVYDNTSEGVIICDLEGNILDTNPAFSDILGYSKDEVLGDNPRIWQSGRHDASFYQGMWRSLMETGQWRGEIWNRRKDGSVFPEWLNISTVFDADGERTHYVAVFSDISQIKQSQEKLDHLAHHDPLTGLPNRLLLNERLEQAILRSNRLGHQLVVIFLDLDRFKHINDSLGHLVGDKLLLEAAQRFTGVVRQDDTVARIGGDEFVLLLENAHDSRDVSVIAEKIIRVFKPPFVLDDHEVSVTASLGICLYPDDGEDGHSLLRNADAAMYRAKENGRDDYHFYTQELTKNAFERVLLENSLRQAISNDEFYLVYQPQICLQERKIIGLEALIRWKHPQLGVISPAKFIPVAEEAGLIHAIGRWVMLTACQQGVEWLQQGLDFGRVAINVAGPQIKRGGLVQEVESAMQQTGLDARYIELEVTETFIMQRAEYAIAELHELRKMGITLAIDDFGTGYSSLSYLKALPIHKLKIDQSFVRDIPEDSNDMAIADAIIAMGRSLDLTVIAEGIETPAQAKFLLNSGCNEGQGYLYSKPLPIEELNLLLAAPEHLFQ